MRLTCPNCDHVITGHECACGFHYYDRREYQHELQLEPLQMQTPQVRERVQMPIFPRA